MGFQGRPDSSERAAGFNRQQSAQFLTKLCLCSASKILGAGSCKVEAEWRSKAVRACEVWRARLESGWKGEVDVVQSTSWRQEA